MTVPVLLPIVCAFVFGYTLGIRALSGLVVGAIISGSQLAIASANTGADWHNAKKYIENGEFIIEE